MYLRSMQQISYGNCGEIIFLNMQPHLFTFDLDLWGSVI